MAGDKRTVSKEKGGGRKKGVAAFGVAGALSLATCICGACKASASTTSANNQQLVREFYLLRKRFQM